MGIATLGFKDGPSIRFRIDPQEIQWQFAIETNVTETLGGRVLQVVGATLGNITIRGEFGENRTIKDGNGQSWLLAEAFAAKIKQMMAFQSAKNNTSGKKTASPAIFAYSPRDWRFEVYVVSLNDTDGGSSVNYRTGKFSHGYELTLFIVKDLSPSTANVGSSRGVVFKNADKAIQSYINRIAEGIGWKQTDFNGPKFTIPVPPPADSTDGAADSGSNVTPPVGYIRNTDPNDPRIRICMAPNHQWYFCDMQGYPFVSPTDTSQWNKIQTPDPVFGGPIDQTSLYDGYGEVIFPLWQTGSNKGFINPSYVEVAWKAPPGTELYPVWTENIFKSTQ